MLPSGKTPFSFSLTYRKLARHYCSCHELLRSHKYKTWNEERKTKLTASTFTCALGFRRGGRINLWREKIGLTDLFQGAPAIWWNNAHEDHALARYKLITGNDVKLTGFHVHAGPDDWLAASPDGLVDQGSTGEGGVLEIKCPFVRHLGEPRPLPWDTVPACYMPQAQGLMQILDRNWMDFFVWTPKGSSLFRVCRNREYWGFVVEALRDFWWKHVVPVRDMMESEREFDLAMAIAMYQPSYKHELFDDICEKSEALVRDARLLVKEIHEEEEKEEAGFSEAPLVNSE